MYMYIHTVYTYQIAVNSAQSDYFHRLLSQQIIQDYSPMAFKLVVNRSRLVQDTLNALVSSDPFNFKKPLQVLVLCMHMYVHVLNNVNAYIVYKSIVFIYYACSVVQYMSSWHECSDYSGTCCSSTRLNVLMYTCTCTRTYNANRPHTEKL